MTTATKTQTKLTRVYTQDGVTRNGVTYLEPQNMWGETVNWGPEMVTTGKVTQQGMSDNLTTTGGMDTDVYTDRDYRFVYGNTLV